MPKKHKEVKGGWSVEYNCSHGAAVSRPLCQGAPSTPVSLDSGNDGN